MKIDLNLDYSGIVKNKFIDKFQRSSPVIVLKNYTFQKIYIKIYR